MTRTLALFLTMALAPATGLASQAGRLPQEKAEQAKPEAGKKKREIFTLRGTVFTEQGLAMPGAQISVRRAEEKKVRGKATADRRGEFGVRLREGGEYEVTVEAKGFQAQTRKLSAQLGNSVDVVFKMQPASGGKP